MKKGIGKYLLFLVLMIALHGSCAATTLKQATMRKEFDVSTGLDTKLLLLKKIFVIVLGGEKIGATQAGLLILPDPHLPLRGGNVPVSACESKAVFCEDLSIAGYSSVRYLNVLFEEPGEGNRELLVAGFVKEMKANIYHPKAVFRNHTTLNREVSIKVKCQSEPPIRVTEVNRGKELYAIAPPIDKKWPASASKGIAHSHFGKEVLGDSATIQIPRSVRRRDQNAISLRKEDVGQEKYRVDEAERLKFFLFFYCNTFESKDIDKFAALFAHDAIENNKPFHELLPKYRRNMEMIESLDYRIELVDYSLQINTGNIELQGKYSIRYLLYGGAWKEKSGNISMELTKRGISYLVKRLNYSDEP